MQVFRYISIGFSLLFGFMKPLHGQDKSGLSFSERTGIKGITAFLSINTFANNHLLDQNVYFNERISSKQKQEIEADLAAGYLLSGQNTNPMTRGALYPGLRVELILAPFRLNSKKWKRNIEWSHGFSMQNASGSMRIYGYEDIDSMNYDAYGRTYSFSLGQFNYQSNIYFNYLIGGATMLYLGLGAGVGIPVAGSFESSEGTKTTYTKKEYDFVKTSERTTAPAEIYNYEMFNTLLFSSMGLKVHISCRINLHAEYALITTQHYLKNGYILPDIRHGLNLGLRYKFNKPEPKKEGEDALERKPFW